MMGDATATTSPAERSREPLATELQLLAETARDHGWTQLPTTPRRIVWRKEAGDHYRRIEVTPDGAGRRPALAYVLDTHAPEDAVVTFLDDEIPGDLFHAILDELRKDRPVTTLATLYDADARRTDPVAARLAATVAIPHPLHGITYADGADTCTHAKRCTTVLGEKADRDA